MTRRKQRGGWVLLETLCALAVLSIGIIAVNKALGEALISRALARDYTEASFYLQDVMGRLKVQPQVVDESGGEGVCEGSEGRFRYAWAVDRVPFKPPAITRPLPTSTGPLSFPVQYLGRIRVVVTWTRQGRPYRLTSETLVQPERVWIQQSPLGGTDER